MLCQGKKRTWTASWREWGKSVAAEGIEVTVSNMGDLRVNMKTWGWFPAVGSIDIGVAEQSVGEEEEGGDSGEE